VALWVAELHTRSDNPDYDMSRVALQTWAEALRDPALHEHARASYRDALGHVGDLATRWRDAGQIPADADTKAVAATVFTLMPGLIVMHHLVGDVSADSLLGGISSLGAALHGLPRQLGDAGSVAPPQTSGTSAAGATLATVVPGSARRQTALD